MNSPPPHRGKVFCYKQFQFDNGGQSDKLLILVNEPVDLIDWIFIKTTSKPKPQSTPGCHSFSSLYVLNQADDFFSKKTWVQFQELYPIPYSKLQSAISAGNAWKIGKIKEQNLKAILNCMKNSPDLSKCELQLLK